MLIKEADLKQSITDYFQSKSEMGLINLLAPSVIGVAVNAIFGTTWVGRGIDLLLRMIGVDFQSILGSLINGLCGEIRNLALSKGKLLTPEDVDQVVKKRVEDAIPSSSAVTSGLKTESYYYQGKLYKIANPIIKQSAGSSAAVAGGLSSTRGFLTSTISFIFKVALAAAGMELFADIIKSQVGMKSDLDMGWLTGLFSSDLNKKITPKKSRQTKFPRNPNFIDQEVSRVSGGKDRKTIRDTYVSWANEAYLNVDQGSLNNSSDLDRLVDVTSQIGLNIILGDFFIVPSTLRTKLEVVNFFIDDVAAGSDAPENPRSNTSTSSDLPKENPASDQLTSSQQEAVNKIKAKGFPAAAEHAKQKLLRLPPGERDAAVRRAQAKLEKFEQECVSKMHMPTESEVIEQIDSI